MKETAKPFTMIFEETAPPEDQLSSISVEYDPAEGLSYVHIDDQRIPFIEWSMAYLGTKTGDHTKQIRDPTDKDPGDD